MIDFWRIFNFCKRLPLGTGSIFYLAITLSPLLADASRFSDESIKIVLFPSRQAVISANVDTTVKTYNFNEGQAFKQGDLLTELDERVYQQKYLRAEAAYNEAKSNAEFAKKNVERSEDFFNRGIHGKDDLEKSRLELDIGKSKMIFYAANMEMAAIELKNCRIEAPFAGRLIKKYVHEHEFIRAGQPLMKIIDDNQLLAVMHLPSGRKNHIQPGQKMFIKVDETGTEHAGIVHEIAGEIDPASRTFELKVLIDNSPGKLAAGMSGQLIPAPSPASAQTRNNKP